VSDPPARWTPAGVPARRALVGTRVRLEPLDAQRHAVALHEAAVAGDPALWRYLPYGPFATAEDYAAWARAHETSLDPRFYAVVDLATARPGGVVAFQRMTPAHGVIEIGHVWFGAALQRTPPATEAIYLLARHAFDDLGHRRLEWKCDAANARSRAAAQRLGFRYEGTFCQHMVVRGRNRDTAWYALLDGEWPAARAALEAWLAPGNFDAEGRQRRSLAALRP
jgi:RimJ/RimL family protein N-acetyltransferase